MQPPLISIIVPNYNHAIYLPQRLDSIFNQEFQNFEVLLLDDCSNDCSVEILKGYEKNPQVKWFAVNSSNSGSPFLQWKKGVEKARGKYIWIAESDDITYPEFLLQLVTRLEEDEQINLIFCKSKVIDSDGKYIGLYTHDQSIENAYFANDFVDNGMLFIKNFLKRENVIPNASAVLLKRQALTNIPWSYLSTFRYAGDWLIYLMALQNGKIAYVNTALNCFRKHSTTTRNKKSLECWKSYFSEKLLVFNYLRKNLLIDCSEELQQCAETLEKYITFAVQFNNYLQENEEKELVIYGCGGLGEYAYNVIKNDFKYIEVFGFIDKIAETNPSLTLYGSRIMTLKHFLAFKKDIPVCIASVPYADEIERELLAQGLGEKVWRVRTYSTCLGRSSPEIVSLNCAKEQIRITKR